MSKLNSVDYLNAHGTSTPAGDPTELNAIKKVFKEKPIIGSTKSQTGHALGAAGVLECIYSILMLKNKFIAESLNLSDPIDEAEDLIMANQLIEKKDFSSFMSNSFGFGGTNASIVVKEFN
jgi:3-oxoacyl-[acyl-carrier-protein] synthase-1